MKQDPRQSKFPIAVLASGNGSNLQALIDQQESGQLPVEIKLVICNKSKAYALERAKRHSLESLLISHKKYASREDHERELITQLEQRAVKLVVLAGYMRLLTPLFVNHFHNRIINLHPALCPAFPGTNSIERAYQAGVKVTGVTVHFVDEGEDTGPIILQQAVAVDQALGLEQLEQQVHQLEHQLLPQAVRLFAEGRLQVEGKKVIIRP